MKLKQHAPKINLQESLREAHKSLSEIKEVLELKKESRNYKLTVYESLWLQGINKILAKNNYSN